MNIAIDALGFHYAGGGRSYVMALLEPLLSIDTENRYTLFLSQAEPRLQTEAGNVRQIIAPTRNRFLMRLWLQLYLARNAHQFDLVHFAKNLGVFGLQIPTVVTLYDMTTLIHPEIFPRVDVWYWKHIEPYTLKNASLVIAISQTTARDIVRLYGLPEQKIRLIYPAIEARFKPAEIAEIERVKKKYHLPESYFIHVGRIDHKKNLPFLVRAYHRALKRIDARPGLVLVGEAYPKSMDHSVLPAIQELGLEQQVIFTGRAPDEDLPALYSGAIAAVYPSLHEGFGIAQIEALSCGAPLVAHSAGAVSEVVQDGGIVFPTLDLEQFSDALIQVHNDPGFRQALIQRGLARAKVFHGDYTARQTLAVYQEILGR